MNKNIEDKDLINRANLADYKLIDDAWRRKCQIKKNS